MRTKELLALGVFGRGSRLGDRIEMLLERGRDFSPRASKTRIASIAIVLSACVIAAALAPRRSRSRRRGQRSRWRRSGQPIRT